MGSLRELDGNPDQQSFPGATFEIEGEVPATQCAEAIFQGDHGITTPATHILTDVGAFPAVPPVLKTLVITSPLGNVGDYFIIGGDADHVQVVEEIPDASVDNEYFLRNGPPLQTTRNLESFANYIAEKGFAYTIKGGKLFTNIPSVDLEPACSINFDPL